VAVQAVQLVGGQVHFAGTVDFSPERMLMPGPTGFPPALALPGAIGDADYSPLISTGDGIVLNAPQVANISGFNDSVVSIDLSFGNVSQLAHSPIKQQTSCYHLNPTAPYSRFPARLFFD
jgi:hypothetical protein